MEASTTDPRMPAEPQDEGGTGSTFEDLVSMEDDVPRVGDDDTSATKAEAKSTEEHKTSSSKAKAAD